MIWKNEMNRIKLYDKSKINKDNMMVSNVGSAAVSAVSLVDSINALVIQVFSALAAGAAIICSRYLGRCISC